MDYVPLESVQGYLPMEQCKHGFVYKVRSRNLYGKCVYNAADKSFIGIREKFGSEYLFGEYHWDSNPHLGTAKPIEEVGPLPEGIEVNESGGNVKLFEYLQS